MTELGKQPPGIDKDRPGHASLIPARQAPEYRRDPVTGRWVVIASERASRPGSVLATPFAADDPAQCPFCEGREHLTPPEVAVVRATGPANGAGWSVRVVPNQFPAVRISERSQQEIASSEWFRSLPGGGRHEVVLESPLHHQSVSQMTPAQVGQVFRIYRDRLRFFREEGLCRYALVFKNCGEAAGASQPHPHSQIIATTSVPPLIAEELTAAEQYWQDRSRRLFADLLAAEESVGTRIVTRTRHFAAWCPYASRFPFELWILPVIAQSRFDECSDELAHELGELVRRLIEGLECLRPAAAYNYYLHTAPLDGEPYPHYQWHLEVAPRILGLAGFELGGGMFINPVPPEWAAQRWRDAIAQ